MRALLRLTFVVVCASALTLVSAPLAVAGDRAVDPEGDASSPETDIVAVTSEVTGPNLSMGVELAADWLYRNDLELWLSTGTHGAGVCWGWDADFAVQLAGYDAQMTSAAENWDPVRAEPVAISVDGPRVIFELPLAQLGDPEVLYFAVVTADRGPFSDVFPDTPGFPEDEAPTCHEFAGLPDTAMTPTDDVGGVLMLVGATLLVLGPATAAFSRRPARRTR